MLGEGQFLWEIRNEKCVKFKVLSWVKNATFVLIMIYQEQDQNIYENFKILLSFVQCILDDR